ncbi:hypothetical protein K443DRAFT_7372 [Laccaria amethystina LaAM-08-1]|uniref:Uncharacterized protein n=1 Tax=Laccaria amethystina LaAM-08-1 TaxID=1095629 RepID=A0A0C9X6T7_9AGAR|nr:hypothetical protein K443DRAFT_7372 [Laccaria amethystina LaAM-08-1]
MIAHIALDGIPPRLHEPKSTAKTANKGISKPKQTRKQVASEGESGSDNEDSEPAKKKARDKKHQCVAAIGGPEVEVESVDEDAEPAEKEVEEEDANGNGGQDDQEEEDDLNEHQCGPDLQEQLTKKDTMFDLLTMMSD